ncbi:pyridoxal phosphate-dependent aminotransferase [Persicobacter psychrovividus]|uniref:Aminotransferase n=1 Tax=Persicobacter psychrovividus TaxID=387638 RepID=A0ABN6L550_9BACT|nr:aminotransferase [Persicobacter psychrovividus]
MDILSNRVKSMTVSATLAMAQKAREIKAQGANVISLSLGEPDFKTPQHVQDAAKEAIDSGDFFSYTPVPGYQDLREAIAAKLKRENGIEAKAENIVVSTGAKHSIANVFMCILDDGDEVIIYSPFWVSYPEMVGVAGGKPVFINAGIEKDFKATADQLEAAITPKTKAIIFSSPCNPTGAVFSKDELQAVADVVTKHENIVVIADEIYEYINFTGKHCSIATLPGMAERTITVNGLSKGHAMTGWRIGYICAPEAIAKACIKLQGQFTSGTNSIAQRAAIAAFEGDMEPTKKMGEAYYNRRSMVYELLSEIEGVKLAMPEGAFYFFPDISAFFGKKTPDGETIKDANDVSMYLLTQAHVSTVSGAAFGAPDCLRISYAASEEQLREAIARIKDKLALLS